LLKKPCFMLIVERVTIENNDQDKEVKVKSKNLANSEIHPIILHVITVF